MNKEEKIKEISNIIRTHSKIDNNMNTVGKCPHCKKFIDEISYWISDSCRYDITEKICNYLGLKVGGIVRDVLQGYFGKKQLDEYHTIFAIEIVRRVFI